MAILLNNDGIWHDKWLAALSKYLPEHRIYDYPNIPNPEDVNYAIVWRHPVEDLKRYPNLKAVMSLGSGVDHWDNEPRLEGIPIYRLIDTNMADDMALYSLYWTIHFQRQFALYQKQQTEAVWQRYPTPLAPDFHVGVLGLGAIGSHIAQALSKNGFKTSGWSRSPKQLSSVNCVHGQDGLYSILSDIDVLLCCLPLNKSTREFLGKDILGRLRPGAYLINISRGAVIDDPALLDLLNSGHIGGAALDVFAAEPLPKTSGFWNHPAVNITPHMSGATNPDTAAKIIAKDIEKLERGELPDYPYTRSPM